MATTRRRKKQNWLPVAGNYASYCGKTSKLLRGGKLVIVVAEATAKKTVVKALNVSGQAINFTVNTSNLMRPQPSLFDEYNKV